MRSSNPLGRENARQVLLYDLTIFPLEKRKESRLHFINLDDAAKFLGVHRHKVMRGIGGRITSLRDGKVYAMREPKRTELKPTKDNEH